MMRRSSWTGDDRRTAPLRGATAYAGTDHTLLRTSLQ
jgi:hypothetical protein